MQSLKTLLPPALYKASPFLSCGLYSFNLQRRDPKKRIAWARLYQPSRWVSFEYILELVAFESHQLGASFAKSTHDPSPRGKIQLVQLGVCWCFVKNPMKRWVDSSECLATSTRYILLEELNWWIYPCFGYRRSEFSWASRLSSHAYVRCGWRYLSSFIISLCDVVVPHTLHVLEDLSECRGISVREANLVDIYSLEFQTLIVRKRDVTNEY